MPCRGGVSRLSCWGGVSRLVLVDDLKRVVVDVLLVDEPHVLCRAVVALENLDVVFLYLARLLKRLLALVGDLSLEEAFPLAVSELYMIQRLKPTAEVGDQLGLGVEIEVFVALFAEKRDEPFFERGLALVEKRVLLLRLVASDDRVLVGLGD